MTGRAAADWGRVAATYDRQLPLERAAIRSAVDLAQPHREDTWLDVGTGTGGLLRELAARGDPPHRVNGVDACAAMLAQARALPAGWVLEQADARCLPFADNAFSVVSSAYLLHVVDTMTCRQIVRECARVLCPGGRLVVVTPAWPRTRMGRVLYAPLAAAAGSGVGPRAGLRPFDPRTELESAGFTMSAARHLGRGYPSLCVAATR